MPESEVRMEFLWQVHSYMNEHIRHADLKAELVIGWTSALMGVLIAVKFHDLLGKSVVGIACCASFLLLGAAFVLSFATVIPRMSTTQLPGFIFWKSVLAHKDAASFAASFKHKSEDELNVQIACHIYDLSKVADTKFRLVRWGIILAFSGSIVSGVTYISGG